MNEVIETILTDATKRGSQTVETLVIEQASAGVPWWDINGQ